MCKIHFSFADWSTFYNKPWQGKHSQLNLLSLTPEQIAIPLETRCDRSGKHGSWLILSQGLRVGWHEHLKKQNGNILYKD